MAKALKGKDFVDFIEDARKGQKYPNDGLEKRFNDVLMDPNTTEEDLVNFFKGEGYALVPPYDCESMIRITKKTKVDFHVGAQKY